ncbi:MAG TPA: DciA family protein, partial [Chitinophagaceae bacterium]|nr:DciA family protein [Chitinophagaceae bacterium]
MGEYSISEAMQQFLNSSRIKGGIQALQIEDVWEEIMGKTIARYTDKLQIIGDKLIITTSVAPLK